MKVQATRYAKPLTATTRGLYQADGTPVTDLAAHIRSVAPEGSGVVGQPINLPVTVRVTEPGEVAATEIDETLGAGVGEGVALQYNVRDAYGTTWQPGCFSATQPDLLDRAFPLLWMHSRWEPVGVFRVTEDTDENLRIRIVWDDTVQGRDCYTRAKSGSAPGLSVGVMLYIDPSSDDLDLIRIAELIEVSQITLGQQAVPGAGIERSAPEGPGTPANLEADVEVAETPAGEPEDVVEVTPAADEIRAADEDALALAQAYIHLYKP